MKNCYVIINKNDFKSTKHLVDNIIDYNIIDVILIIDNCSNQKEIELLNTINNKKIEKIYNNEDHGYAKAINDGCKYLIKKYKNCNFIISNSDVVIMSEQDLVKLIELLNYENVGLVGPQILERGKKLRGRKIPSVRKDIFFNLPIFNVFTKKMSEDYDDSYYKDDVSFVEVISSAFFLTTSKVLKKINYLDENTFIYYEDNILGYKLKENKLLTIVCNDVKVKHLFSSTIENTLTAKDKFNYLTNSQMYFHKTYSRASKFKLGLLKFSCICRYNNFRIKRLFRSDK